MTGSWVAAFSAGALVGAVFTPRLAHHGLAQLADGRTAGPRLLSVSTIAGCSAGAAAVAASRHAGGWWVAPALVIWACALVAVAACDAVTQRIPTALVRQAGVVTGVLLITGMSAHGDWRGVVMSGVAVAATGLTLMLCWHFAGAGFGDVRLAALGGLGLGHAARHGLMLGLAAFVMITLVQVAVTLLRGAGRHAMLPYGPALATGFLLAATV